MKVSEREGRVLKAVRDHGHLSELAIGTICVPPRDHWGEDRRRNLGRAVALTMRSKGLLDPSALPGYWREAAQ
jgi:hypothetical protein